MRAILFTKPPLPGRVKTRLIPALGAPDAACLHEAFVRDTLALTARAGLDVCVALAGDPDGAWAKSLGVPVIPQVAGDLGARMAAALTPGPVMALGTDAPTLPLELLLDAARGDADLVLGPAFDGGYWTLVWREPQPQIFAGVPWSTEAVLAETLLRARASGLSERLTPYWYDVDTPEALAFLQQHLRVLPASVAPHTRAALRDIGISSPSPS